MPNGLRARSEAIKHLVIQFVMLSEAKHPYCHQWTIAAIGIPRSARNDKAIEAREPPF
jgi:hypothetical protein